MHLEVVWEPDFNQNPIASSVGFDIVVVSRLRGADETSLIWPNIPSQSHKSVRKRGNSKDGASASIEAVEKSPLSLTEVVRFLVNTERFRRDPVVERKQAHVNDASVRTLEKRSPGVSDLILRRLLFLRANTILRTPPSIDDVAKDLLKNLIDIRKNCPERPIVFMGHNIGVVVIERALMKSSNGGIREDQVFRRSAGVIYLSSNGAGGQSTTEASSEYFDTTGRMMPSQDNFRYKELDDKKYFEKHLEDLRATLKKAENTTLKGTYKAGASKTHTRPSAISLFRPLYLGGTEKTRKLESLGITEAIIASLNCFRLLSAACKNNAEELRSILAGGVNVNSQDRNGNTALHIAASTGRIENVKVLLADYEANVALQNSKSQSALYFAINNERNNVEVVKLLLNRGARPKEKEKGALSNLSGASREEIRVLLENPPFIQGAREDSNKKVWQTPIAPKSALAQAACHSSRAVVAEIFEIGGQEKFILEDPTIDELLYKIGPEKILKDVYNRAMDKKLKDEGDTGMSKCRWYHIPANNVSATSNRLYGRN